VLALLGSKYRNRVRIYCHLPSTSDPKAFTRGAPAQGDGFTMFKTSWSASLVAKVPGAVNEAGRPPTRA